MSAFYTPLLTLHLLSAILFIGTVFFWTFIIDRAFRGEHGMSAESVDRAETILSRHTRPLMKINVGILLLSGLGLAHIHGGALASFDSLFAWLLSLKILLGTLLIALFYGMPYFMRLWKNPEARTKAHDVVHLAMFGTMIVVVVLAKQL